MAQPGHFSSTTTWIWNPRYIESLLVKKINISFAFSSKIPYFQEPIKLLFSNKKLTNFWVLAPLSTSIGPKRMLIQSFQTSLLDYHGFEYHFLWIFLVARCILQVSMATDGIWAYSQVISKKKVLLCVQIEINYINKNS